MVLACCSDRPSFSMDIHSALISYPYSVLVGIVAIGGTLSGVFYLFRRYVAGGVCHSKALLNGKTVIITGANAGIGKETAVELARRNARVIMACRSVEKGEKAAVEVRKRSGSDDVVFVQLDLASLTSVRQFAARMLEEEPRLNILINNAGVMACPYTKTEDGFEMQFGVNHLAHFLLTNLLLDRLKEAPSARVINVASQLYKYCPGINFDTINSEHSYKPNKAYQRSKLANILFTQALAKVLEGSSVTVNALHPGVVRTELGRHKVAGLPYMLKVLAYLAQLLLLKTPWQGAQTTIYCAVAEELESISGKYFGDCCQKKLVTIAATDEEAAERLWRVSAQMVGLDSTDT